MLDKSCKAIKASIHYKMVTCKIMHNVNKKLIQRNNFKYDLLLFQKIYEILLH